MQHQGRKRYNPIITHSGFCCFGLQEGEPVRPGVAMTDLATGLYAHGAIMAALLQRQKTGTGSHIDCNLLSSQVLLLLVFKFRCVFKREHLST